jgi:multidrug resistance efflux pump
VEVGDVVKKGQVLATLDMETVYTDFDKAEATLNSAKRDLEAKQKTYRPIKSFSITKG